MRTTLSFTATREEATKIKTLAKKRGFSGFSGYIRFLVASDGEEFITEDEVLRLGKSVPKLAKAGKLIHAKSMRDLLS